ncbi:hypothetical protein GCM10027046_22700 [Uliginosibacterium flavum]|uniref:GNAT family N-acetyltransferase n=1 Tax=Uliginosibacterium flavum TaxID=1396831 RepID=A0ABV2TLK8_9RHOO
MSSEFIPLTADNIARFVPLYVSVFNAPPWNDGWTEGVALERLQSFARFPTFDGLGLLIDGEPAALVLGWGERWVKSWIFHIQEFCVAGDRQRSGLGKVLMSEFERRLQEQGFSSVYLHTGETAPARGFYEAVGYKQSFKAVSLSKRLA